MNWISTDSDSNQKWRIQNSKPMDNMSVKNISNAFLFDYENPTIIN